MSPYGIKGFSNYKSFVSDDYLVESNTFYLLRDSKHHPVKIIFSKYKTKKILKISANSDRNQARLFTNYELYMDRCVLKPNNTDEYYHIDLIGLKVHDANDNFIGIVVEITNNNNLDYLKVKLKKEFVNIPFTKKNVNRIEWKLNKLSLYY